MASGLLLIFKVYDGTQKADRTIRVQEWLSKSIINRQCFRGSTDKTIAPWYHYIPLKPDYSDLYDIMAFFVGPLDDAGHVDFSKEHDVSTQISIT